MDRGYVMFCSDCWTTVDPKGHDLEGEVCPVCEWVNLWDDEIEARQALLDDYQMDLTLERMHDE
jgi:hypothetical protein